MPTELLKAVGTIVVNASAVDGQVGFQILRMIGPINYVPDHAWPVVAGMEFQAKLAVIRTLAAVYKPEVRDYIVECCNQMQTLYKRRNQLAHSVTNGDRAEDGSYRFVSFKGDPKMGGPAEPLRATVKQMEEWGKQLFVWSNELEQTLSDLGFPYNGPTQDDVADRPSGDEREARRPESRSRRTTRKKPRPAGI